MLQRNCRSEVISPYLNSRLSDGTRELLSAYRGGANAGLQKALADDINRIIQRGPIYAVGRQVWRQPLAGGARQEIPIVLDLSRPIPHPLLLRGVRVLDMAAGSFGLPTSLLLENGRIQWIGSESGRNLPKGATVLDATDRFAIPGLFDLHVHSVGANEEAFLAYEVTSLRDTSGWLA